MKLLAMLAAGLWSGILLAGTGSPIGIASTPTELVASVERASRSEGFRLRATITRDGQDPAQSLRVLIAGQKDERRQKLLIRALAPEAWRDQTVVVESEVDSALRAVRYAPRDAAAAQAVDPNAPLFDSGLVPSDLLGEWRRWPRHARIREEPLLGHDCVVIESRGGRGPVARVRSWIAPQLRIPLRIEFYGADGALLRAIRVHKVFRRADGTGAARSMTMTDGRNSVTHFEIYNGEEGIALAPDTFFVPEGAKAPEGQDSK